MVGNSSGIESVLWDDWFPVGECLRLEQINTYDTTLLGVNIRLECNARATSIRAFAGRETIAHVQVKYGFVWICLGQPNCDIVEFPECREPDRLMTTAGSTGVAVSGLRAVENFLDLSHLGIVHEGYLGEPPHNEVETYSVTQDPAGGIIATGCKVYQPLASPVATEGYDVDYIYRVLRPYSVVLYKANPTERTRKDLIALFLQPVSEERCIAHILTCYLKDGIEAAPLRRFQQLIFGQDRPILENQVPKRLPLDVRAEISIRADGSSAAYRRYLTSSGVRYGAIDAS